MKYHFDALNFDRPYEAIMRLVHQSIRGATVRPSSMRLEKGLIQISGYEIILSDPSEAEVDAVKRIMRQQNFNSEKFKTFNKIVARIKVPVTEAPKNHYRLETIRP